MPNIRRSIAFVCLGNICRSPLAEAVFRELTIQRGVSDCFELCSRGTGAWHIGEGAHRGSRQVALAHEISLEKHRACQIRKSEIDRFDLIVAMDRENQAELCRLSPKSCSKIVLLRDYDSPGESPDVPDPYYGGEDGFKEVYEIVERCSRRLLDDLLANDGAEA